MMSDFIYDALILSLAIFVDHCLEMKVISLQKGTELASVEQKIIGEDTSSNEPFVDPLQERLLNQDKDKPPMLKAAGGIEIPAVPAQTKTHLNKNTALFTVVILLFKGFNFMYLGLHTSNNPNLYKLFLILLPMVYFLILFFKIEASIETFRLRTLVELCRLLSCRLEVLLRPVCPHRSSHKISTTLHSPSVTRESLQRHIALRELHWTVLAEDGKGHHQA